jgi:hypothetical protein|tara:strand:- start:582 stop:1136 length:555 start_codon:yes stop_codon:yes gene_type:complete
MSVTTTSKIAYKDINESGVSKNQKDTIYDIVNRDNTGTGMSLKEISAFTGIEINAVSGRVNDLKKENRLETTTKRKCNITNRLISPVIIKTESSKRNMLIDIYPDKEDEDKVKLLLKIYGYENVVFKWSLSNKSRYIRIGYWKPISKEDLEQIHINSNLKLEEISIWDDDCGNKYWYDIKPKGN